MINIYLNGRIVFLDATMNIHDFLTQQKMDLSSTAVAINRNFVPKAYYKETMLQNGDAIECVIPMQGG